MIRVYVVVEGPTEESFVGDVLAPLLWQSQVYLTPIILGSPGHPGGRSSYVRVKKDVLVLLKQDRAAYCSTMIDFYGLGKGFPGTPLPPHLPNLAKVIRIETALKTDIIQQGKGLRSDVRFLPYLQLHEFEGLLFSDPVAFAQGIYQPGLAAVFQMIREQFATPEDINDNPNTAPSKRILKVHPAYRKPLDGKRAALQVGIAAMRQQCPHFHDWLQRLEALAADQ